MVMSDTDNTSAKNTPPNPPGQDGVLDPAELVLSLKSSLCLIRIVTDQLERCKATIERAFPSKLKHTENTPKTEQKKS